MHPHLWKHVIKQWIEGNTSNESTSERGDNTTGTLPRYYTAPADNTKVNTRVNTRVIPPLKVDEQN